MLIDLRQILLRTNSGLQLLEEIILCSDSLICHICMLDVSEKFYFTALTIALYRLSRGTRFWMLQDLNHMEASYRLYVWVSKFDQREKRKLCVLTVSIIALVRLTMQYCWTYSVWFMYDPGAIWRQISPEVLSIENFYFVSFNQHICMVFQVRL
jgi:hypothetical protein